MSIYELAETSRPGHDRDECCVVLVLPDREETTRRVLESLLEHTPADVTIVMVSTVPATGRLELERMVAGQIAGGRSVSLVHAEGVSTNAGQSESTPPGGGVHRACDLLTATVNRTLALLAPADVVLVTEPCVVSAAWLERLASAAHADTNTATASALTDTGTALGLYPEPCSIDDLAKLANDGTEHPHRLYPRLAMAVGPCVYVRRSALELVGPLDQRLPLRAAVEVDLAQRCVLSGLAHVAADDVVVGYLAPARQISAEGLPELLLERYPYLAKVPKVATSSVLAVALETARRSRSPLWVTIDARALDGAITGTQVHILELILALARTETLHLRLLIRERRIDRATLELLRGLPSTELLPEELLEDATPKSTIFHRPQQTFAPEDVELALALGERLVLSQLDLIAYRNPGYFASAAAWEAYGRASRHGMCAAERVIVFSDHTRRDLLSDALVEDERIRIVSPGLNHREPGTPSRPAALAGGAEPADDVERRPFLLCLGTDFRHKNRVFALRLLSELRERHDWPGNLVLAGTHILYGSSLELEGALLEQHPELRDAVVELGTVSDAEKAWLMQHASATIYPSVYEGFGLVPFESALNGVPCVFARQSSLADVAPDGTAKILPWNAPETATAVQALLSHGETRTRHVDALAGAARALTWETAATSVIEIYREAAVAPVRQAATLAVDAVERERKLTAAHEAVVEMLIDERGRVLRDYNELIDELGPGRSLIGPRGALPENLQRALLTLAARPGLSRPLYGAVAKMFVAGRAVNRAMRRLRRAG